MNKMIKKIVQLHTMAPVGHTKKYCDARSYGAGQEWLDWLNHHGLLAAWMKDPAKSMEELLNYEDKVLKVMVIIDRIYFLPNNEKDWL